MMSSANAFAPRVSAVPSGTRSNDNRASTEVTLSRCKTSDVPKGLSSAQARAIELLSIGDDPGLLDTRDRVLESAGFIVRSTSSAGTIEEEEARRVDLVLICHSVEQSRARAVASSVKTINPGVSVLQLCKGYGETSSDFDLITADGPQHLIREIEQALEKRRNISESAKQPLRVSSGA